jgi:hypothetical protein
MRLRLPCPPGPAPPFRVLHRYRLQGPAPLPPSGSCISTRFNLQHLLLAIKELYGLVGGEIGELLDVVGDAKEQHEVDAFRLSNCQRGGPSPVSSRL